MKSSVSIPNLPGMLPDKNSWIYKEREGFRKSSRPNSAAGNKYESSINLNYEIDNDRNLKRPSTAGGNMHRSQSEFSINQLTSNDYGNYFGQSRPQTSHGTMYNSASSLLNQTSSRPTSALPDYVVKDKKVCRFYGYFYQERPWERFGPLGRTNIENKMFRQVKIHFYLVDNTVEIFEPKTQNSGILSGTFYKRGPLYKDNKEPVSLQDLSVGNKIRILGRDFYIVDADKFTREYFRKEFNIVLSQQLPLPNQTHKDFGAQEATGLGPALPSVKSSYFGTKSTDYINSKDIIESTNRFFRYEGKVLKFMCVEVDSLVPPYFPELQEVLKTRPEYQHLNTDVIASADVKRFTLCYYLSTNNIELLTQKTARGGEDDSRLVLKKTKLPKNWRRAKLETNPQYYGPYDFRCGQVIDIFGRLFLVVTCDKFTKIMFNQQGIELEDVPCIHMPVEEVKQPIPELGDGFLPIGSNEDTLATVYGMPKPTKDFQKIQRNQNRILRCKAVMLSANPVEQSRTFMITFFLEDDTIQVYEEVKRNSGVDGGNYLKRGRYLNDLPSDSEEPRYFMPNDIYLGSVISLNGKEFQITEMDNMSLKFCENYPDEFPMSDTFKIIGNLVLKVAEMGLDLRPAFAQKDTQGRGWLDQQPFIDILDQFGLIQQLNDQELLTLLRRFKDGEQLFYRELCDLFSHVYYQHKYSSKGRLSKRASRNLSSLNSFLSLARSRTIQWRRTLRKDIHTLDGYLTLAVLAKLFEKYGLPMNEYIVQQVYKSFRVPDKEAAPYLKELHKRNVANDLFEGLDLKVRSKSRKSKTAGQMKNSLHVSLARQHYQDLQRRRSVVSVLRNQTDSSLQAEMNSEKSVDLSMTLIDYNKLCDEIYICDWA